MFRIKFAHHLPMAIDEPFHAVALTQQFVPIDRFKLESVSLSLEPILCSASAKVPRIVVQCHSKHGTQLEPAFLDDLFQKSTRPVPIVNVRTRCDERKFLMLVMRTPGCPPAILDCIFLRSKIPATSPRFVADTPVANMERLSVPGRSPHVGERCAPGR